MKGKTTKRDERRRKLASALIIGAMGGVAAQPALAQHIQQISDERIEFEIAAQPLSSALSEFARQARVNALYFSDDLRGLSAPQLRGSYTRQQALDLLLARSGYNGRISGGNLVLAQEQSSRPQRESAASGAETTQASNVANGGTEDEEEIVVTGTRIRGAVPAGANLLTLDRGNIEESGRTTVQDLLQTLPQVFPGSQGELTQLNSTAPGNNIALGSTVDLRGLGSDATLTLLNGRRLAPAGLGNFVDIVLVTDRRSYAIEAIATSGQTYSAQTAWRYPAAENDELAGAPAALETLNFGYRVRTVRGFNPRWRPIRVFDDGRKTYIEFPPAMATSEAPPLFIIENGEAGLVNYRVSGSRYVVDRLFDIAELRIGAERPVIVRISREGVETPRTTRRGRRP